MGCGHTWQFQFERSIRTRGTGGSIASVEVAMSRALCSQSVLPSSSSSIGTADVRRHAFVGTAGSLFSAVSTYSEHSPGSPLWDSLRAMPGAPCPLQDHGGPPEA
eukprot:1184671-Pyramimonas_sp.AAC.1